jgi:hypothetical protein
LCPSKPFRIMDLYFSAPRPCRGGFPDLSGSPGAMVRFPLIVPPPARHYFLDRKADPAGRHGGDRSRGGRE